MDGPYFGAQLDIDLGGAVFLAVDDIGVERSGDGSSRFGIVTHLMDVVVHVAAVIEGQMQSRQRVRLGDLATPCGQR
jgi:hypothetical protein